MPKIHAVILMVILMVALAIMGNALAATTIYPNGIPVWFALFLGFPIWLLSRLLFRAITHRDFYDIMGS